MGENFMGASFRYPGIPKVSGCAVDTFESSEWVQGMT